MTNEATQQQGIVIGDTPQDLSKKTVCLKLRIGVLGNRRKVSNSQVEVDADKDLIRVSKKLLDSKELQAVKKLDSDIRRFLYDTCLPFEVGVHLLPFPLIEKVNARLKDFEAKREILIERFIQAYPKLLKEAAERLRSVYNADDYSSAAVIRSKFSLSWQYVNFGVPGQLKEISVEIFKDEREKAAKMMAEAASEIQLVMRESLAELVKHLAERLDEDPTSGKPKRLRESSVGKLKDFLDSFDFRNVVDDQELKEQVDKARKLITGASGEAIRTNSTLRASIKQGMAEISVKLNGMIVEGPRRKFRFDDEEGARAEAA